MAKVSASEHAEVMKRLRDFARRYNAAIRRRDEVEEARSRLYVEARSLEPPITYKVIGQVFGVSEAAVMQKERRWLEQNGRAKRTP